jgi:type I restriction enzyme S subunit
MNATQLLAHFDRLAEAPNAVPRLRRFILDLAVRGKLVEQDALDEPASTLLKQIESEIARLVKIGEMRKPKALPPIETEEEPFDAPTGWRWVRIRQVTSDRGQTTPVGEFTYIDVGSINKEAGILGEHKVLSASEAPSRARKVVGKGDVLYSCVRPTLLNIAVVEDEIKPPPIASTAFAVINSFGLVSPRYIWITLRSPYLEAIVESGMRGQAYPAINDAEFALLPLALPPLTEQHRIVAKVDELMALCDQLEAAQQERERRRDRLAAASLQRLNQPAADATPEAQREHARFHLQHLPHLSTRPEHIKGLRDTFLELAMRGILVSQDICDGRVLAIATNQRILPIAVDEIPFDLPESWAWTRLGSIAKLFNGDRGKNYPNRVEYVATGLPFINTGHIEPGGGLSVASMNYLTRKKFDSLNGGKIEPGDLVYCLRGATMGKTAFVAPFTEGAIASSLVIVRLDHMVIYARFAYYFLTGPLGRILIRRFDNGTAQPNLSAESVKRYLVPLPPLAEQHRIVAKVDALMALCDQLEAQLTTTQTDTRRLLEAVLESALAPV